MVTTSYGNEGVNGIPGRDLLVADDPAAFAEAVVMLLTDAEPAARLTANGRNFVREHYSLNALIARLERVYGDVKEGQ